MTKENSGLSNVRSNDLLSRKPPTKWDHGPAFWGAYLKGWEALRGSRCPYPDCRAGEHHHVITYSRAFRRFWSEGYDDRGKNVSRYAG